MKFEVFSKSKTGINKLLNQDSIVFGQNSFHQSLFAIADGVGTYRSSQTASRIACDYLYKSFLKHDLEKWSQEEISNWIKNLIQKDLQKQFQKIPEKIATTISFAIFMKKKIYIVHVGDTRIYQKKEFSSTLFQLTRDHSSHQNQINKISWTQGSNFLDNSLGNTSNCFIDEMFLPLEKGIFLFTTDGLHDFVPIPKMNEILNHKNLSIDEKIQTIFNHAIFQGSGDDATMIFVNLT